MKHNAKRALAMLLVLVMVLTVFPVMTSTATAAEPEAQDVDGLTYGDIYVKDGLVAWFDAFGVNNATVDLANQKWTATYGDTTATIVGGTTWWEFRANGGFGYDMTQDELNAHWAETEVVFDINLLNEEVFTFETFLAPYGPTDGEGNRSVTSGGWGNYRGASTFINVGNLRTLQFGGHDKYSHFETRFTYTKNADGWNSNQGAGNGISNSGQIRSIAATGLPVGLSFVYQYAITTVETPAAEEGEEPTVTEHDTAIYDCYQDGNRFLLYNSWTTATGTAGRDNDGDGENDPWWQKLYYPVLPTGSLKIAGAFPSTVYSARVYDRALTKLEMLRNHAADIAALTGADLSVIPADDEFAINALVSELSRMDNTATKSQVEAVAAACAQLSEDTLYVKDGLLIWLDGSDATSVDLAGGKWYSKVNGTHGTLTGSWKAATVNTGLGYRYDLASPSYSTGIEFDATFAPVNFTVEMWALARGCSANADGVTPAINDGKWGGHQATSMAIGPLVADTFACERTPGHEFYNNNCAWNEISWYGATVADGGSCWSREAEIYSWGIRDYSFRYDGTALCYSVIKDNAAVRTYNNVTLARADLTLREEHRAPNGQQKFYLFRGFPAEVYGIRVYDRVLSATEMAQNHLVDLVKYVGIPTADLAALSDAAFTSLAADYAGRDFDLDKAALKNELDADIAAKADFGKATKYDELYVKDGLVQLLSAFGTDYGSIDQATGNWYSKMGSSYAVIHGGLYNEETNVFGWKNRAGGGIGYDMTSDDVKAGSGRNVYIDLGDNVVDSLGDYTLEYAANVQIYTEYNSGITTEKFGHWGTWSQQSQMRILYHAIGLSGTHGDGTGTLNWGEATYYVGSDIVSYSNVIDNTPETSYRTVVRNGVTFKIYEHVGKTDKKGAPIVKFTTPFQSFFIMRNTGCTVYAVRMYDRALTEDEILLNHFADLCAYTGAELGEYASYTDYEKIHVAAQFAGTALNTADKAALEAAIASAAGLSEAAENVYDELYVKDGLAALFTAYSGADSVSLSHGIWASKVGLSHITLTDTSALADWEIGAEGMGVGYSFASLKNLADNLSKIGMYLPVDVMQDGNMAIEYVFHNNPVMRDGKQVMGAKTDVADTETVAYENLGDGYPYGVYNAKPVSSFSFAGLNMCQFHRVDWDPGASTSSRFYYAQGSWENFGGDAGGQRTFTYTNAIGTHQNGYDTNMMTLSFNRTLSLPVDAEYINARFDLYKNGAAMADGEGNARIVVNTGNLGSDNQRRFWSLEQLQQQASGYTPFHAFFALPATVYSIRMYNKTLTEAEMKQNHAVDLMAYFKMDVEGFAAASEEAKARVYEAFAEKTFEASALEVSVMQAAIDRAVEDSIVGVIVSQKNTAGNALRIVGALETTENVSRVGFVITFKQNGEVVRTFGAATLDNETTVTKTVFSSVTANSVAYSADDLCAEYLYAAVVKGITVGSGEYTVEVTPFYVTLDDVVETGETKTTTVSF